MKDLSDYVIYDIIIYNDDITLYSKCDQTSDFWLQLELISELESDTVDWGRNWLADFNAGETQLVSFDWCHITRAIDVKMDGSVFEKKSSFKILGVFFSFNLDCVSSLISIHDLLHNLLHNLYC